MECRLWSWTFACVLCVLLPSRQVESQPGFLSIDCGAAFSWSSANISWVSDNEYISTGITATIDAQPPFNALRYFPENSQSKHCYILPTVANQSYIVRAGFCYGNYDKLSVLPSFDLLFEATLWTTVTFSSANDTKVYEMVVQATDVSSSVCVARLNGSSSIPFISSIEVRPLPPSPDMYSPVHQKHYLNTDWRINFGQTNNESIRYPYDKYDRIWESDLETIANISQYVAANTTRNVTRLSTTFDNPPLIVMQTARIANMSQNMTIKFNANFGSGQYYLSFFFAEVLNTTPQQHRLVDMYIDQVTAYKNLSLSDTAIEIFSADFSINGGAFDLLLRPTQNSNLGPILNAAELYFLQQAKSLTYKQDVIALSGIKEHLNLTLWNGDPCAPQPYKWSWLGCNYSEVPRVIILNLSSMGLEATIPMSIANLTALTVIDLHNNKFYGDIPSSIAYLKDLLELDLRNNNFSGAIPRGLEGSINVSASGNPFLCMPEGEMNCTVPQDAPTTPFPSGAVSVKSRRGLVGGLVGAGIVICTIILLSCVLYSKKNHTAKKNFCMANSGHWPPIPPIAEVARALDPGLIPDKSGLDELCKYSFAEMQLITKDFKKKVGESMLGTLFYGVLPSGNQVVVKLLQQKFQLSQEEFQKKVIFLSSMHHKNLLIPIGFCADYCHQLIVLEYMPKGSLYDHLYNNEMLDWKARLHIMLQVAQGLEYLHFVCSPSIVHGNIKSTNVLLNDAMVAKLTDIGLHELTHYDGNVVDATLGYIDPEYFTSSELTRQSDVFSFGVLLLEITCGRRPFDTSLQKEQWNIIDWVKQTVKGINHNTAADPSLQGRFNINSVSKVIQIALQAVEFKGSSRPTMVDIVAELKEAHKIELGHHVAFAACEHLYLNASPMEVESVSHEEPST